MKSDPWCRRSWQALAASLALVLAGAAPPARAQAPGAIAAENFVMPPRLSKVVLSPSGKRIAMLMLDARGRKVAATMLADKPGDTTIVGVFADADVESVAWVNDDRLVYEAFRPYAAGSVGLVTMAVDHDGKDVREIIGWRAENNRTGTRLEERSLTADWRLWRTVDDGSDDVLVRELTLDGTQDYITGRLARVNTRSGRLSTISQGVPPYGYRWLLDARGEIRIVATVRNGRQQIHWKPPGKAEWQVVAEHDALAPDAPWPVFLEGDGTLVLEVRTGGRDTSGLHAFDLARRQLDPEPLLALNGYDADALVELDDRTRQAVGVHTRGAGRATVWFDERLAGIQKAVDDALPKDRSNRLSCGRCLSSNQVLVHSVGDRHPGEYFVYDHGTKALVKLGEVRPSLAESTQGRRSFHRVAARDGLSLPVYLTHPRGQAPAEAAAGSRPTALPAVVWVHGGPWMRGHQLAWDDEPQFLASRGYRVIEVDFRGSTGYGWRHFRAGWKAWGTAMQDDLADAVAWAVREGLVDGRRVCIGGASYGGYAALMAPIRHPGVFRCAISHIGVTDIELLYTSSLGDLSEQVTRFSMPQLVGDRRTDAALLDAASPLKRVAELKLPVMLSYGGQDRRVPRQHADRFASAARAAGVALEVVPYEDEGHGFSLASNHADFLRRVEAFLGRHNGAAP